MYRSMQVLLLVFSLIFFFIIAYGYYNLLLQAGAFLALLGGAVMAVFAWYLARVIGSSGGGLRKNAILFAPLLIISAAGVYNSLMVYLEGGRILADTATEAQTHFAVLQKSAEDGLRLSGGTAQEDRVRTTAEALYSEMRNPLNCGQGPRARQLISDLQRQLPGFTPLSSARKKCEGIEDAIKDYQERIEGLIARAPWNTPELKAIAGEAADARRRLDELRATITTGYSPVMLRNALTALEEMDAQYRDARFRLSRHVDVKALPQGLHLSEVQSLGNAFKLLTLFLERLDELATYVYLAIAVGFDLLMVHLFQIVASNRVGRRQSAPIFAGAW
jgi:hypothetical protein